MNRTRFPFIVYSFVIPEIPLIKGNATLSWAITESIATIFEANYLMGE